jgi:hypothetical protein
MNNRHKFPQKVDTNHFMKINNNNNNICYLISFLQVIDMILYYFPNIAYKENMTYLFRKICNFLVKRDPNKIEKLKKILSQNVSDIETSGHVEIEELFVQIRDLDIFSFQIENLFKCTTKNCNSKESRVIVNENILKLHLPNTHKDISIQDCYNITFQEEEIERVCEKFHSKSKKINFVRNFPEILFVQLLRYQIGENKNNKLVKCESIETFGGHSYELIGIINHIFFNNLTGHYYTNVKYGGTWFEINDKEVSKISKFPNLENAYLYIFKKRNPPKVEIPKIKNTTPLPSNISIRPTNNLIDLSSQDHFRESNFLNIFYFC